jgi:hypothetical protein
MPRHNFPAFISEAGFSNDVFPDYQCSELSKVAMHQPFARACALACGSKELGLDRSFPAAEAGAGYYHLPPAGTGSSCSFTSSRSTQR